MEVIGSNKGGLGGTGSSFSKTMSGLTFIEGFYLENQTLTTVSIKSKLTHESFF